MNIRDYAIIQEGWGGRGLAGSQQGACWEVVRKSIPTVTILSGTFDTIRGIISTSKGQSNVLEVNKEWTPSDPPTPTSGAFRCRQCEPAVQ